MTDPSDTGPKRGRPFRASWVMIGGLGVILFLAGFTLGPGWVWPKQPASPPRGLGVIIYADTTNAPEGTVLFVNLSANVPEFVAGRAYYMLERGAEGRNYTLEFQVTVDTHSTVKFEVEANRALGSFAADPDIGTVGLWISYQVATGAWRIVLLYVSGYGSFLLKSPGTAGRPIVTLPGGCVGPDSAC